MRFIKSIRKIQELVRAAKRKGKVIGLVPTMGFLHEGHLSLVDIAKKQCDLIVVSIFVNPTQFGPNEDFKKYPRNLKRDLKLLGQRGVDIVFYPSAQEMYPDGFKTEVAVEGLTEKLCGISRPGHFAGVTTVVLKLFNAVMPDIAVFGEKDYQQQLVIKKMVADLNLDIKVLTGKIVRDASGLAMSSRNRYLSAKGRELAAQLNQTLLLGKWLIRKGEKNPRRLRSKLVAALRKSKKIKLEYLEVLNADNLDGATKLKGRILIALAVRIAGTRLIDNIVVSAGSG